MNQVTSASLRYPLSVSSFNKNSTLKRSKRRNVLRTAENGAHLAEGAVKDTGYVHATVLLASFLPLSAVRSLGLFSTVGEGCISLVAEVGARPLHPAEVTALVGSLPREKRSF